MKDDETSEAPREGPDPEVEQDGLAYAEQLNTPAKRLWLLWFSSVCAFDKVDKFRRFSKAGLDSEQETAFRENIVSVTSSVPMNFKDDFRQSIILKVASGMASNDRVAAEAGVDGVSLVFAHALVEALVSDCLRIALWIEPAIFVQHVRSDMVSIESVLQKGISVVLAERSRIFLSSLRKKSLPNQIEVMLSSLCIGKPIPHGPLADFKYDRKRMQLIDKRRHEIVHNVEFGEVDHQRDFDYLRQTCLFLVMSTVKRFGLEKDFGPLHPVAPQVD
jgi:hypothetical protein